MTDSAPPRIFGLLLAAGRSTRMGRLKLSLPWGDGTVISSAYDALNQVCNSGIFIVLGDHTAPVLDALGDRPITPITGDSSAPQFHSILLGLHRAIDQYADLILLQPGDHPMAPVGVLSRLIGETSRSGHVVIPTINNRGGHPAVIPTSVATRIIDWAGPAAGDAQGGLKTFWRDHPEFVQRLPCNDHPELLVDLDTPEAYDAARARFDR